ncbi:KpsF/GutQ family sugar-phosphate isomerase [Shewanella sp. VB17]|uniref:KpsF/GutQ family sugar-phosphate isomerase n=1 Tax=Shewanella sp. VB17 TaxID=2739432 RepID=UPI001565A9F1|nr:KpsF/GutQ family sugar-phosphate isomerase [Shewanella sp. VB17]NRD72373.1 KpsF/GutQ family sugar-phosphate isomerase [Shewanella sp. VB17]
MPNNVIQLAKNPSVDNQSLVNSCKETLHEQSQAMASLAQTMDTTEFAKALSLMKRCDGHVIVCGMGKSGHVGRKISATLASTGTPSFFLHPAEAFHGDLGMVTSSDVVILISNSGESDEILKLIPSLQSFGNKLIAITGKYDSTLAKNSDALLLIDIERESCPNNLAPTTSTTLTMAIGDALAVALMKAQNFMPMDFAKFHPGGSLGRRLLTKVKDVMVKDNLPFVSPTSTMNDVILTMTASRLGLGIVLNGAHKLLGVITDGDLRRALVESIDIKQAKARDIMSDTVITIDEDAQVQAGEELMRETQIKHLVVVNDVQQVIGVLEFFQ